MSERTTGGGGGGVVACERNQTLMKKFVFAHTQREKKKTRFVLIAIIKNAPHQSYSTKCGTVFSP